MSSIITKLNKIINPCPSKRYVIKWETSYHYQTKTSSRRGGIAELESQHILQKTIVFLKIKELIV